MGDFASSLKCPVVVSNSHDAAALKALFDWYISLEIPYETVSNVEMDALIKTEQQMLRSVLAGDGGHCVEHSLLLTAVLRDFGFQCTLVNADYHNRKAGTVVKMAKPLVVVELGEESWVCDPYYRSVAQPILQVDDPSKTDGTQVSRESPTVFSIRKRVGGTIVDEDRANMEWTIHDRRLQFELRYKEFSPFGVTAPLYQRLRPVRTALFYSPEHDSLLVSEGSSYRLINTDELALETWVPETYRDRALRLVPGLCETRAAAGAFIKKGLFQPTYIGNALQVRQ